MTNAEPKGKLFSCSFRSSLLGRSARTVVVTADDLDLLGSERLRIFKLEVDVLDEESPDFVAEAVGIEMAL